MNLLRSSKNFLMRYSIKPFIDSFVTFNMICLYSFIFKENVLRPGFEPGSEARKASMLDRYTIGANSSWLLSLFIKLFILYFYSQSQLQNIISRTFLHSCQGDRDCMLYRLEQHDKLAIHLHF